MGWWVDFIKAESTDSPTKWLNIQEVRLTQRLVKTPVALVTSQFGYSAKMEKAYASQGQDMTMTASKTLELNPDHPVIFEVYKKVKADPDDASAKETAPAGDAAGDDEAGDDGDDEEIDD